MSCAPTSRRRPRRRAARLFRTPRFRPAFLLFVATGVARALPAAAQLATGLTPPGTVSVGGAPGILPPAPSGPFGLPNPLTPPNALPSGITPAAPAQPAYSLALPPPGAGITTLQLYDPNAPAILIQPTATIAERFTDNVFYTHSDRRFAAETSLIPGVSISVDTPRFQGVLSGSAQGNLYLPTSSLNQIFANLYGAGTGTVVPDRLFVDLTSLITQSSPLAGLGFVNTSLLPSTQQTQIYANTISPYIRQSFDGLIDSELRYRLGTTNFGGNTLAASPSLSPASTTLANSVLNEGTLTVASGRNFERALSRMTIDALNFNSSATDRNTQFNAFNDLEYRITPNFAALGRVGYQNIQYPFAPEATFAGATWLAGGRVAIGPNYGYVSLEYGRQQGVYGFTGSAQFQATPTISVSANLVQGISSPSQYLQTSLASSTLGPNGAIVDPYSGLPTAFYNPGLGLTNNVYRQHLFNAQISDVVRTNTYSLYGYYSDQQSLTPPITAPTKSVGAYLTWARDIRPDLNGSASLGYSNTTNIVTLSSVAPLGNISTWTANIGVNYLLSRALTGSILYTFSYQPNGGAVVNGHSGDILANSLQFLLTKAF